MSAVRTRVERLEKRVKDADAMVCLDFGGGPICMRRSRLAKMIRDISASGTSTLPVVQHPPPDDDND